MYSVNKKEKIKGKIKEFTITEEFPMGSSNKVFTINDCHIKSIKVLGTKLARPMATEIVRKKYHKLIEKLTELLINDDDDDSTGDTYHEALNEIERFRQIIKNKYRVFLERKELELMSKKLKAIQEEVENRLLEINDEFNNELIGRRSK